MLLIDQLDESGIWIGVRDNGELCLPFAPVAQANSHRFPFFDENFFDVMHGADLTAGMDIGSLQHLRDGMGTATGQLGLFIAGNHFKNFYASTRIVHRDAARNSHLRQHEGLYGVILEQLVNRLSGSHAPKSAEVGAIQLGVPTLDRSSLSDIGV